MSASNSSCVNNIYVDVITRRAFVEFKDGSQYDYTNISFRGLFEWAMGVKSIGQWVNTYLLTPEVDVEFNGYSDVEYLTYA